MSASEPVRRLTSVQSRSLGPAVLTEADSLALAVLTEADSLGLAVLIGCGRCATWKASRVFTGG